MLYVSGTISREADLMAGVVIVARVCQSLAHIATAQTDRVVTLRFSFFFLQLLCFLGIASLAIAHNL